MPAFLQAVFSPTTVAILLSSPIVIILLDLLTGTISAAKQGVYDHKRFSDFVRNDGVKYAVGLFLVIVADFKFGNQVLTTLASFATMASVLYSSGASMIENITELLPKPVGPVVTEIVKDTADFIEQVGAPIQPAPGLPQPPVPFDPSQMATNVFPTVSPAPATTA